MDLNKEIKLSELFKRPKKQKGPAARPSRPRSRSSAKKQELVGLKVGASQIAASRVVNDRGARARPAGAHAARAGDRRRRRGPRRPGARPGARQASSPSTSCRGAASVSGSARTASVSARSTSTASTTSASSGTLFASAPTRRSRSRSTRPCSTTTSSVRSIDDAGGISRRVVARGRLQGADRPLHRGVPARAARSSSGSISRRSPCFGRSALLVDRTVQARRRSSRSRSVTTGRRSRSPTARSATSRACSSGAAAKLESAVGRELGLTPTRKRPRSSTRSRSMPDAPSDLIRGSSGRAVAIQREVQILARELVASLQFYQNAAGIPAHRRDSRHGRDEPAARDWSKSSSG